MNPLEDIIVALRAKVPKVPFAQPNSVRPLSPSNPLGAINNYYGAPIFLGVDPSGNPVTVSNVFANFGHEYIWHCHLLGHEENDMMRAVCLAVPPATAPVLTAALTGSGTKKAAVLTWTASPTATSYTLQKASDSAFTLNLVTIQLGNVLTYTDVIGNTTAPFYYRVFAVNTVGGAVPGYPSVNANSAYSNTAGVQIPLPPVAPSNLVVTIASSTSFKLTWTDNSNNETGFEIWGALFSNGSWGAFTKITTVAANTTTYTDGGVTASTGTRAYEVRAINAAGPSAFTAQAAITMGVPAAPSGLTATAVRGNGYNDTVTLTWTDNSNNEASWTITRAPNAGFTAGVNTSTVTSTTINATGRTITATQTGLARATTYYYRIQAVNVLGASTQFPAPPSYVSVVAP